MENIMPFISASYGAVSQGVLWGIMTLGVYITFKVLDYADLTVDGSFATGGAVSAILIVKVGMNPFLAILFATFAGMITGMITGLLHTKLKIAPILSGILSMLALYSINLRILGQANVSLLGEETIITKTQAIFPSLSIDSISLLAGLIFTIIVISILYWFFGTEIGCCIRATGNNEFMVRALGGNTDRMKMLGLVISNGLVALSGALVSQTQGYADVGMGIGTIVIGLASVIIGDVIFGFARGFIYKLISAVVGSIIYRIVIALVLQWGLNTDDLKLLTAAIVALALSIPVIKSKFSFNKNKKNSTPKATI